MSSPLGIVITTIGRIDALEILLQSLRGQLADKDKVIIVAQGNNPGIQSVVEQHPELIRQIEITQSMPGISCGRNAGAKAFEDPQTILIFPNDTTAFPPKELERLRQLPVTFQIGAQQVVTANGPIFEIPEPGTPLNKRNVWLILAVGLVIRNSIFRSLNGFDTRRGTGSSTPWQAGEETDFILRFMNTHPDVEFHWLHAPLHLTGVEVSHELTKKARRQKLRGYSRGIGKVYADWHYPLWRKIAFLLAGLLIGIRHRRQFRPLDGCTAFVGRLEGLLSITFSKKHAKAISST